ncbi:MAG TPA: M28 family peptidase [Vicinamibacterales bacterium]|nr:M28 family peptidase [Vicinamibacterales bacterium]
MKQVLVAAVCAVSIASGASLLAQMRPGAKVEKTYGIGLPRDMDRLLIPDEEYPVYPLKPGQEAYADVDGYRIKDTIRKITAFSLQSLDAGELYWGRIPGTKYHQLAMDFMAGEYARLGLQVRRQPVDMLPLWYPTRLSASYAAGTRTGPLLTLFPINETKATPPSGITADAVWVGIGSAADLAGRDLRGKAVLVYSTFVPGGRSHSASDRAGLFNSDTLVTRAGAALIINVMAVPGNGQFNPEGAPDGPDAVPTLTISQDEGFMLRDMLAAGQRVRISVRLDIEEREGAKTENIYATLPGMSDEQLVVLTHTDGFFQGAMDNASGMATGIDIARHYAALPREQRPRTMVFMALPDHHHGEAGRTLALKTYDWSKVALILNAEHTSQTLLYMYNQDLVTANAISARRWYVSGAPALQQLVKKTFQDFNVSVYRIPERSPGGSLGPFAPLAPAFHIIDHVIYHTTLDVPELVPAVGLAYSERAFLKVFDEANRMTMGALRGGKLPNALQ